MPPPPASAASPADIAVAFTQVLRGLGLSVPTSCTHTFAAALCATGPIEIRDCANVATSFPGFVPLTQSLGLQIQQV